MPKLGSYRVEMPENNNCTGLNKAVLSGKFPQKK